MINLTATFHLFTKQMENYIQSRHNLEVILEELEFS